MSATNKQIQLVNDLMQLQCDYNTVVKRNLELRKEMEFLSASLLKERMEHEREVAKLIELLNRAVKFESPSTTIKRKKKESLSGGAW